MSFDYESLQPFDKFEELCHPEHYQELSDEWWVIVTDIQGSTKAIQEGRYKDVNLIGAASIMAILNAVRPYEIPFVFGGDGATVCVPEHLIETVKPALRAARKMSREQFGLGLRLGLVQMKTIHAAGKSVQVAKFKASDDYAQAMFDGDGLAYAESLIKDPDDNQYRIPENDGGMIDGDFSGLECRWQNIGSPKGEMHAILVAARTNDPDKKRGIYQKILAGFSEIYPEEHETSPVTQKYLKLSTDKKQLSGESKVRTFGKGAVGTWLYFTCLPWVVRVGKAVMKYGLGHWKRYREDLIVNSDYRKYDEMLRMVLVGSDMQRELLGSYLEAAHQAGDIYYGIHHADSALMTCIIFKYHKNHVHFIDAANGGYAMAAKQLKTQMKTSAK